MMDGHRSPYSPKDFAEQHEDSGSDTDEELAQKAAAGLDDMYHMLFSDNVDQSESRLGLEYCSDESDFTVDNVEHSFDKCSSGITHEAGGFNQPTAQQLPESPDNTESFTGPAEWRGVWDWDVCDCNHMTAEHDTRQNYEPEISLDSDELVDDVGSACVGDSKECHLQSYMPYIRQTIGDSDDVVNAVSSSVVVNNEPVFCTQSTNGDRSVYDKELSDSDAIQSVLDDVVISCMDDAVLWDSSDEFGLTELDKRKEELSRGFTADSSEDQALSMHIPFAGNSGEYRDHCSTEDSCASSGFMAGYGASTMFAQRSSYTSGAHGWPMESKWNPPPRTPPSTEPDTHRWKKKWRKNSAGKASTIIHHYLLTDSVGDRWH